MIAKDREEKQKLRIAGKLLARTLRETRARALVGTKTSELDLFAERMIRDGGAIPVFLNYQPHDAPYPYPATLCVSINNEVVHGLPSDEKLISDGDVVSLDLGLSYEGFVVDSAVTFIAGKADKEKERLLKATKESMAAGIEAIKVGGHAGDIGAAVAGVAKDYGYEIVRDLGGHGTGQELHEAPFIANFGQKGRGEELVEGMVLAIEPIFTLGHGAIKIAKDGWTYVTRDGSCAAHFEHTILIGKKGAEILTV